MSETQHKALTVKATNDNVFIKLEEVVQKSSSGIVLGLSNNNATQRQGRVLGVGPGKPIKDSTERAPMAVKLFDVVMIPATAGTKIKIDGIDVLTVKEDEILGIVE